MLIINGFVLHLLFLVKVLLDRKELKHILKGSGMMLMSLDLTKLHQEIMEMKRAKLNCNATKAAKDILKQF